MNTNTNLLKEAIADAKILRTTAMENVKQILGPYFENKLNEVFDSNKKSGEATNNSEEDVEKTSDSDKNSDVENKNVTLEAEKESEKKEDEVITQKDIDQIINSLKEDLEEIDPEETEHSEKDVDTDHDEVVKDKVPEEDSNETKEDVEKVNGDKKESDDVSDNSGAEEEIDIDELIRELELDECDNLSKKYTDDDQDKESVKDEENEINLESLLDLNEAKLADSSNIGKATDKNPVNPSTCSSTSSEIGLENKEHVIKKLKHELAEVKSKLEEALKANQILKNNLSEVNLLNSKLFYSARLFKDHSMTPEQKKKVIEMIDLAESVRDAKRIYTVILETLNFGAKQGNQNKQTISTIAEGIHSSPVGGTAPQSEIITDADKSGIVERMKRLAGIS